MLGRLIGLLGAAMAMMSLLGTAGASALAPPIYRGVSYGPSPSETATIFAPRAPGATTVILIHGGGWRFQKLATEEGYEAKSLQLQGFAVFDINFHQDSPTERAFPLETNDVAAATEWAIANASTYGANPTKVVLLGGSAGGQLAARTAELLDAAHPGTVQGVISLSGAMNFATLVPLAENRTIKDLNYVLSIGQALGCAGALSTCSPEYEAEWSPTSNIPASACPDWLLFSSEVDVVAASQAKEMLADLQQAKCNATLELIPTGHGFSYWQAVAKRIVAFLRAE